LPYTLRVDGDIHSKTTFFLLNFFTFGIAVNFVWNTDVVIIIILLLSLYSFPCYQLKSRPQINYIIK